MASRRKPLTPEQAEFLPASAVERAYNGKYIPEYAEVAFTLCARYGFSKNDLARAFGVCVRTIDNWRHENEEFFKAIQQGQDAANTGLVEDKLLELCMGITWDEITTEDTTVTAQRREKVEGDGYEIRLPARKTTTRKRFIPPNYGAIVFYLINRAKARWTSANSAKVDHTHEHSISGEVKYDFKGLEKDELLSLEFILSKLHDATGREAAQTPVQGRKGSFSRFGKS